MKTRPPVPFKGTVDPAAWKRLMSLSEEEIKALKEKAIRELNSED